MEVYSDEWQGIRPPKTKTTKQKVAKKHCARCGADKNITADHIIPLAILRAMGIPSTESRNLQPLCFDCNQTKGSQLDPKNRRTRQLMNYYLNRWSDLYQVNSKRRKYVFKNLEVKSLTPQTYYFAGTKKVLEDVYKRQHNVL